MGFGYLLIGYLVSFLLYLTANVLKIGFLALFVGYGSMCVGFHKLKKYCRSFAYAEWCLYPLLLVAVYRTVESLSESFLWNLSFVGGTLGIVVNWVEFLLIMVFHALMLSSIREIGMQVELKKISDFALRNSIIVLLYAVVYLVCALPISALDSARGYFGFSLTLLNLAWVICNLILLVSCTKNICAEGQEELEPKRYRWEFLNRIGDTFDRNMQKASDSSREAYEDYLRKKQEKRMKRAEDADRRNQQNKHHKKKRK